MSLDVLLGKNSRVDQLQSNGFAHHCDFGLLFQRVTLGLSPPARGRGLNIQEDLWGLLWEPRVHFGEFQYISGDVATGRKLIDLEGLARLSAVHSIG